MLYESIFGEPEMCGLFGIATKLEILVRHDQVASRSQKVY